MSKNFVEPKLYRPTRPMDARCKSKEETEKTLLFLELEKRIDEENCKEMLKIEPSHLTKGKITAMGKLAGTYKRASNALIKKYKTALGSKKQWEQFNFHAKERKWITI